MGLALFASCDSDRDDNPVIGSATSFTLNQPAIGQQVVDLASSSALELKAASQPDYGFPAQVNYSVQMSLTNNFTDSTAFYDVDYSTNALTLTAPTADIDKGIMQLMGAPEEDAVKADSAITLYLRLKAKLNSDATGTSTVYSNVQSIQAYPYWQSLVPAEPVFWYMTGNCFGDGAWTNGSLLDNIPMGEVKGAAYDAKGLGDTESIIYLPATAAFKLKGSAKNWDTQWGLSDGNLVKNNGNSKDIVPTDGAGYYVLHYNTADDKVTLAKSEKQDYPVYTTVSLIGTLQGTSWDKDIEMTPVNGVAGEHNHIWYAEINITAEGEVFKFRANNAWDANWGYGSADGEINTKGFGTNNGKNIGLKPGKYAVYLNDIDGFYRMIPVE